MSLAAAVTTALYNKLWELGPADLANALWALAREGMYDMQFVSAAAEAVWDKLPEASPRQMVALVQAYAWFRHHDPHLEDDEDLCRSVATRFRSVLHVATDIEVALLLSSLAQLRRPDAVLLEEACREMAQRAPTAPLPALAEAAWACALLLHRDEAMLTAVAERVAGALRRVTALAPAPPAVAASVRDTLPLPLRKRQGVRGMADAAAAAPAASAPPSPLPTPQRHYWWEEEALPGSRWATGPVRLSPLWPTQRGPGGHLSACTLRDRFNPSVPDEWNEVAAFTSSVCDPVYPTDDGPAHAALPSVGADASALVDADVVSKLLWSYGVLRCYSAPLFTLLFRQLPRLHHDRSSWSALARLMGAQIMALELQPAAGPGGAAATGSGYGLCRINPLEAESANAWGRLQRSRPPQHVLPDHFLGAAFVAFQGEADGRDWDCGTIPGTVEAGRDTNEPQPPGRTLSRISLESEVVACLRSVGLHVRPSATVDGMFSLPHTMMINGLTISLEVLSAACCTLDPPHRPMGHVAARLRSLEFRGWKPLVVPFDEWASLGLQEGPAALALQSGPGGLERRAQALRDSHQARQEYLRRRLESLIGEELPPLPQVVGTKKRRS